MSEITKEELKYIRDTMVNIVEVYPDTELPYSIRDKIQKMLDNYCEHHFETIKDCFGQYFPVCMKCGVN